ncbi:hypothetical protein IT396_01400 [Candidatus Nomurabacteria bacterium]|nr:hypothetical protein [Candidatus Nomurabacteria bacterium]
MDEQELIRRGQEYFAQKQFSEALACVKQLQALGRTDELLQAVEAECLFNLMRAPEAAAIMRALLAVEPGNFNYQIKLAHYLRYIGEFDESERLARQVPRGTPGLAYLTGWHMLRHGDTAHGFTELEPEIGIYRIDASHALPIEKKYIKGMLLEGKRVLLALEGGFGDELAYARFAPWLEKHGATVIVGAHQRLVPLIARMSGMKDVRAIKTINPDEYDYYIPAMSMIPLFAIRDPLVGMEFPTFAPLKEEVKKWEPKITEVANGRVKIGIHWQGNWAFDYLERKSPPAQEILKLNEVGQLYSLQRDAGNNTLPKDAPVYDTEAGLPSWESTASVMSLMDYIVTNDTSTAHLAGNLGKKTLVLLPHAPHHYWLPLDSAPWYPNMVALRQPRYGDWVGAVHHACTYIRNDR